MPVFNLNKSSRQTADLDSTDFINYLTGGKNPKYVSADQALQNSDLYSLISQLSADLALVQMQAPTPRIQNFLASPNNLTNGFAFWQGMFAQLLLDGNAYAYRWRNSNGVDLYWEGLRPSQVTVYKENDGSGLVYDIDFDETNIGLVTNVPQNDVIHFRLMSKDSIGLKGYSPLRALPDELSIRQKANILTENALDQSANSPGILSIQGGGLLDANKKAARSRAFVHQMENSDNGPIVLDDLETYQRLEIKGDVAKLLAQVDWTRNQIAKVYGLPSSYLNGTGDQQSNLDMENAQYAKALKRFVAPICSELNDKMNAQIIPNLRPAVDAVGDSYAAKIASLVGKGITANQAQFLLKQAGYFPQDLPEAQQPAQLTQPQQEGGDDESEDDPDEGSSSPQ